MAEFGNTPAYALIYIPGVEQAIEINGENPEEVMKSAILAINAELAAQGKGGIGPGRRAIVMVEGANGATAGPYWVG